MLQPSLRKALHHRTERSRLLLPAGLRSLLLLLLVSLSACTADPASAPAPALRLSVSLHHYVGERFYHDPGLLADAFAAFQPDYSLRLSALDHEAFKAAVPAALASGNTADLYTWWAGARTAAILGQLQPLDELWQSAALTQLIPAQLSAPASRHDGQHYLLPIAQHAVGFFYNRELFDRLGLTAPGHWDELLPLCKRLREAGITPIALGTRHRWPAQFWFDYILLRSAPLEFREQLLAGELPYTHPVVLEVFQRWAELSLHGCFNDHPSEINVEDAAGMVLRDNKAAMTLTGSWILRTQQDEERQVFANIGFFPFPRIAAGLPEVTLGAVDGLVLPRLAPNPAGARVALAFLARPEIQENFIFSPLRSDAAVSAAAASGDPVSVLLARIRRTLRDSTHFAFNYDLATSAASAEQGLNAFVELLEFPTAYRQIADNLQGELDCLKAGEERQQ